MAQSLTEIVAREIRAEMGRRQLNQTEFARILGLSQQAVSRRLSGQIPFDTAELEAISQAWEIPVTRFLNGVTV